MHSTMVVPAAQYLRMSTEDQEYSIANQESAIQKYAEEHGYRVVATYADVGKSGVAIKARTGLQSLLEDVVSGRAQYEVILVYDISRWGRFQDTDEAAHYEFLCTSSGVHIHYCAEPFVNDGTPPSSILKALKRTMAAEYSRELGVKVFEGQKRLVQLGFRMGGQAPYGLRRMMVSADRKSKRTLTLGEYKNLKTDRVILVPGPKEEVNCVREIYAMALHRMGCTDIARSLNRRGMTRNGKCWTYFTVERVLTNPIYTGCNTWHRTSGRLRTRQISLNPQHWILKRGSFTPLVDQQTFDKAQIKRRKWADRTWSDAELLGKLRWLLSRKGTLSQQLIDKTRGMPSVSTYFYRFGTARRMYGLIGYRPKEGTFSRSDHAINTKRLRRELAKELALLFPQNLKVRHFSTGKRATLLFDNTLEVSVVICRTVRTPRGNLRWVLLPHSAEHHHVTLLCRLNATNDGFRCFHVFRTLDLVTYHRFAEDDPILSSGRRLGQLSELYDAVKEYPPG